MPKYKVDHVTVTSKEVKDLVFQHVGVNVTEHQVDNTRRKMLREGKKEIDLEDFILEVALDATSH